ncbi:nitrilase-related carbon-nitrogen hydrolase [Texcoconibacillus texcoconensis]|uniref:Putative amidohydrolase n=1 Tax=Texcoconibacillus texcoconensis TaxID=1095777 RepID=A0A840QTP8_9BACI|nr:nitrilase-related carbon-nitrogen hydrolase [Texcoconibacillus texcoconensis]MBB5174745.1 putative amidohydrolase [Texcoconibacillus texcoconensis]
MSTNSPFKVASIQFNPKINRRNTNISSLIKLIQEAAENGAKLIVTPEMATTGYHYLDRSTISPYVDTIPGFTTAKLSQIAKEYQTYIVIGMAEYDMTSGLYYNSAALVGPEGYIGKYRKIHQWVIENYWSCWGDLGCSVFETELGNISMIICQDSTYFESARLAAVNGADILCFPTNSSGSSISLLQHWAEINGLYVISANRSNTEEDFHMVGLSAVWSPKGEKLAESPYSDIEDESKDNPQILYAEVDPSLYVNSAKERILERRIETYKELMLFLGPWDYTKNTTSRHIHAASIQYEPIIGDKDANLKKVKELIYDQVKDDINLIVLPELTLVGPLETSKQNDIAPYSETDDGPSVFEMKKLAEEIKTYLVFGFVEKSGVKFYNTAVLISPDGEVIGKHRKIHLNNWDESWATPGYQISVTPVDGFGRVGMMIGYDATFPEVAGVLAVKRADLICIPSSWSGEYGTDISMNQKIFPKPYPNGAITTWDAVAKGSQSYTIVANFVGTKRHYKGRSGIYNLDQNYLNDQTVIASENQEEVLMNDFKTMKTDWWLDQERLILTRRTDYYKTLVTSFPPII